MTRHLSEAVNEKIGYAESLYHRLVLLQAVTRTRSGA